jgi:hypothetical protein
MKAVKGRLQRIAPARYTIGRESFAKISAVDGLHMTAAMEADFREFDTRRLSAAERRAVLRRKYGKSG